MKRRVIIVKRVKCISCGGPLDTDAFGGLCKKCYVEKVGIASIPSKIRFVYCSECGSFKYQRGWNEGLESIEDTLIEFVKFYLAGKMKTSERIGDAWIEEARLARPFEGPGIYDVIIRIKGLDPTGREELVDDVVVKLEAAVSVCPTCTARITGRGYEAEVKVRGAIGPLSGEKLRAVKRALNALARGVGRYIAKIEEADGGVNIYLTDQQAARVLAGKLRSMFGGEVIESYKLVGRKPSGKRKGRLTISVRIPEFRPGDMIIVGDRKYIFLSTMKGGLLVVDAERGKETVLKLTAKDYKKNVRVVRLEEVGGEARRVMLLSKDGPTMVFLDADKDFQDVIEIPSSNVKVYVDGFEPGQVYLAYRIGNNMYVVARESSG